MQEDSDKPSCKRILTDFHARWFRQAIIQMDSYKLSCNRIQTGHHARGFTGGWIPSQEISSGLCSACSWHMFVWMVSGNVYYKVEVRLTNREISRLGLAGSVFSIIFSVGWGRGGGSPPSNPDDWLMVQCPGHGSCSGSLVDNCTWPTSSNLHQPIIRYIQCCVPVQ